MHPLPDTFKQYEQLSHTSARRCLSFWFTVTCLQNERMLPNPAGNTQRGESRNSCNKKVNKMNEEGPCLTT